MARKNKQDEFYTKLDVIEDELQHYQQHLENKIIFCNCDDDENSNFWKYFSKNFNTFKLKKLIGIHWDNNERSYKIECFLDNVVGEGGEFTDN